MSNEGGESRILDFLIRNHLDWPDDEDGLIGSDGLVSRMTEDQAGELYEIIKEHLNDGMWE